MAGVTLEAGRQQLESILKLIREQVADDERDAKNMWLDIAQKLRTVKLAMEDNNVGDDKYIATLNHYIKEAKRAYEEEEEHGKIAFRIFDAMGVIKGLGLLEETYDEAVTRRMPGAREALQEMKYKDEIKERYGIGQ